MHTEIKNRRSLIESVKEKYSAAHILEGLPRSVPYSAHANYNRLGLSCRFYGVWTLNADIFFIHENIGIETSQRSVFFMFDSISAFLGALHTMLYASCRE